MSQPVCLITGTGDGTGAAIARRFASGGYRVAMLARTSERLDALANEIAGAQAYVCDVSDLDNFKETIARVKADLGAPEVAVHNAVLGGFAPPLEADPVLFEQMFRVNATALMVLGQAVAPDMIRCRQGCHHCHRKYIGVAREARLLHVRPDQGRATHPCTGHGSRLRA